MRRQPVINTGIGSVWLKTSKHKCQRLIWCKHKQNRYEHPMSTRHYQGVFQGISTSRLPLEKFHLFVLAYFYSHLKCACRTSAVSREGLALAVCKCPCRRTVRQQRTSPPAVCPTNHSADYSNELFHVLCVFYLQWLLFKSRLIGGSHLVVDRRAASL